MNSLTSQSPLDLYRKRRFADAISLFEELNHNNILNVRETYIYGRCLLKMMRFDLASEQFKQVEDSYRNDYRYWYRLGIAHICDQSFDSGRIALEQAKLLNSNSEIVTLMLAISAFRSDAFEQAKNNLRSILSFVEKFRYLDPKNNPIFLTEFEDERLDFSEKQCWPELCLCKGILNAEKQEDFEARDALRTLYLGADLPVWGTLMAAFTVFPYSEFQYKAVDTVKKCQEYLLKTDHTGDLVAVKSKLFLLEIVSVCSAAGLQDVVCRILDELLEFWPVEEEDLFVAGKYYLNCGFNEKSLRCFSEIIRLDPNNNRAYFELALAYEASHEIEHALQCIKFHLNVQPRDILALIWLGHYYLDTNDLAMAEKQIVKVIRLEPKNPKLQLIKDRFKSAGGREVSPASTMPDYGYIDWNRVQIPSAFQYQGGEGSVKSISEFMAVLGTLGNTVSALMVREMTTRFGKNGLGYLWVVIQQVIFVGIFAVVFKVQGRHLSYGVEHVAFLITGINSFFVFTNTKGQIKSALTAGKSLLYYRQISPFAIYISRFVLELFTGVFVFSVLVSISVILGEDLHMSSLLVVLATLFLLGLLGACLGLFISSVSVFFPAIEHFDSAVNRALFFTSGLFFYANELPDKVRELLMWNPLFHLIELLRDGFFYSYTAKYASIEYVLGWVLGFLFFSLVLERIARSRLLQI